MPEELEWKTRKERIDKKLKSLSIPWNIIKYNAQLDTSALLHHAVEEYPTAGGPADYALFVKGKLLGIIEGKRVAVGPQNVLEQAKRYSRGALDGPGNWQDYRVPFLYATNGEIIYFLDVRQEKNISRKISGFHTADALEEFYESNQETGYEWLKRNPVEISRLRPYQKEAIIAAEAAITGGKMNKKEKLFYGNKQ